MATVLNSGGVLFAGIMGFIYSDLMVPPLVKVNTKYYGWRVALYIAAIMYVSIVSTALILHYLFLVTGLTPESAREISHITQFEIDYTFYMNIVAAMIVGGMIYLRRMHLKSTQQEGHGHDHDGHKLNFQSIVTFLFIAILIGGVISLLLT